MAAKEKSDEQLAPLGQLRSMEPNSFVFSLNVDFLNTLLEQPFSSTIRLYTKEGLLHQAVLNNTNRCVIIPLSGALAEGGITVLFTETQPEEGGIQTSFAFAVGKGQSVVNSFPLVQGKVLIAIGSLFRSDKRLNAVFHSSVYREGVVSLDEPNQVSPRSRVSLTPRRTTAIVSPRGSPEKSVAPIVGAVKRLFYVQDLHGENSVPELDAVVSCIRTATRILGPIDSFSPLDARFCHPVVLGGGFLCCSSKSDIVEGADDASQGKRGKTKRRQLQQVCLGLVGIGTRYKLEPVSLLTRGLVLSFQGSDGKSEIGMEEDFTIKVDSSFSGTLKESNREIMTEGDAISCTVEGTLVQEFRHNSDSSSSNNCLATKVFLSMMQGSGGEDEPEENQATAAAVASTVPTVQSTEAHVAPASSVTASSATAANDKAEAVESKPALRDGELPNSSEMIISAADALPTQETHLSTSSDRFAVTLAMAVKEELKEKQKQFAHLLAELDEKYHAIQQCGEDIRDLRTDKQSLLKQVHDLQELVQRYAADDQAADQIARAGRTATNQDSLTGLDAAQYRRVVVKLQAMLLEERAHKDSLQQQLDQRDLALQEMQRRLDSTTSALVEQDALGHRLYSLTQRSKQVGQYRDTIATQEKLLVNMQKQMESLAGSVGSASPFRFGAQQLKEARPPPPILARKQSRGSTPLVVSEPPLDSSPTVSLVSEQNSMLQQRVAELELQVAHLTDELVLKSIAAVGDPPHEDIDDGVLDDDNDEVLDERGIKPSAMSNLKRANLRIDRLIAQVLGKDFRIRALEDQLRSLTVETSQEIARLRATVIELQLNDIVRVDGEIDDDVPLDLPVEEAA